MSENRTNIRKSLFNRVYCYNCGTPWGKEEILCRRCGGRDVSKLIARPIQKTSEDFNRYEGPWSMLPWPPQGSVCVYGGAGTGKSSIAALVRPKWWITKEQEPKPASFMFRRLTEDHMPTIAAVDNAQEVENILNSINEGPIVLDSLTAFGLRDSLHIAHMVVNWTRGKNSRSLSIMQANQSGGASGYAEIPHLFDAVINVEVDPWGVRCFRIQKSRWCGLENTYFTFDKTGKIIRPTFTASYTVEGDSGGYFLHPFPIKGSKWDGISRFLAEMNELEPGTASAAQAAPYMPSGFVEPMDVIERKNFAQRAGLEWISPEDLADIVQNQPEGET